MTQTADFEAERPRLVRLAARVLSDDAEAEDIVQQAWLRLLGTDQEIDNLPGWLTTVTTRLCLDRLRAKVPVPTEPEVELDEHVGDPADEVALADTVGVALQVVLDRLTPAERVAFVLHDTFGFDFPTIATLLDTTPAAARKLASRARAKVVAAAPEDALADWAVVDAFLSAARGGDLGAAARAAGSRRRRRRRRAGVAAGTPERIAGRREVAAFFDGAAQTAVPVFVEGRPGAGWLHRQRAGGLRLHRGRRPGEPDRVPRRAGGARRCAGPAGGRARRPGPPLARRTPQASASWANVRFVSRYQPIALTGCRQRAFMSSCAGTWAASPPRTASRRWRSCA
jgi:RNA polymerase sigma-70 factor (ECF subfamily)